MRETPGMFVLAGSLGIALLALLGYTYGPVVELVASARRQRRARRLFRRLTRQR